MDYLWIFALMFSWYQCTADNLALLSGTLRTYQQAGCDDDVVSLKCPPGTTISVTVAQYGIYAASKHLCPAKAVPFANSQIPDDSQSCLWPKALQYSLLQTVVEACQKKSTCQFHASPATFDGDPCPGERKYVEVAYKCRPYEFRSRVACENERIQLQCAPNSRVAIYSASYGRTEYESSQCPQPQGVAEETCLVSYATETVMQICHGKRRCDISADASTFGNPCRPQTRMYLRIVYTCVPRKVLNKQYDGQLESDETDTDLDVTHDQDDFASWDSREAMQSTTAPGVHKTAMNATKTRLVFDQKNRTSSIMPKTMRKNVTQSQMDAVDPSENTILVTPGERDQVIGFISAWINTYTYVSKNHERFYVYLLACLGAVILLCVAIFSSRLLIRRRREKHTEGHSVDVGDGSVAHGFVDDISEVDADIDLSPPSDVVLHTHYGGRLGSFAAEMPRSVSHAAASVYYYG
ncbi:protein eva-1-like isoform X2 [Atheta coriaria]|uniref:protein eva-1-like isoform X2 n=1 Tax=Dalotia coriaria TaxID=877792 RepID=UPI0031F340B7